MYREAATRRSGSSADEFTAPVYEGFPQSSVNTLE